jgi:hypothetical protein
VAQLAEALPYKPEGRRFDSKLNLSGRTMALQSTHPLTGMSKVKQSRYRPRVAQRVPGS